MKTSEHGIRNRRADGIAPRTFARDCTLMVKVIAAGSPKTQGIEAPPQDQLGEPGSGEQALGSYGLHGAFATIGADACSP